VLVACHRLGLSGPEARVISGGTRGSGGIYKRGHPEFIGRARQKPGVDGSAAPSCWGLEQAQPVAAETSLPAVSAEQPAINCSVACVQAASTARTAPVPEAPRPATPSQQAVRIDDLVANGLGIALESRSPGPTGAR